MKRIALVMFCVLLLLMAGSASATTVFYTAKSLTGGGATALDFIDGASLNDDDVALVDDGTNFYIYHLEATSGQTEDSPYIISPDSNAGTKRWILLNVKYGDQLGTGVVKRPRFEWKDADEIYIFPGEYIIEDTSGNRKRVFWNEKLTFQFQNLAASDFSYLYIDWSSLPASTVAEIDETNFVDTTTEATYSESKGASYNSDDLCVTGCLTNGSSQLLEFFHDGGALCLYATDIVEYNSLPNTNFGDTNIDMSSSVPSFATRALVRFHISYDDGPATYYWRKDGQADSTGHRIAGVGADSTKASIVDEVITSSSQVIEAKESADTANNLLVQVTGWYFPHGM